jgi:uncharacterized SAM-binding protein YcdF (DUF218 family)
MINPKARKRQQLRRGKLIFLIILAIALIQIIAYRQRIMVAIGTYLVYEQSTQQADVIAIPANWEDTIIRARGGADLFNKGLAKVVFVPRMEAMEGLEETRKRGVYVPENRDLLIRILEGYGVPLAAIETSAREVTDTWEEAQEMSTLVEQKGYTSVLLVTSKYHSRRAYLIFKDALKGKASVISVPSPYDPSNPEEWWKRSTDCKRVITEYQKMLVYYWRKIF